MVLSRQGTGANTVKIKSSGGWSVFLLLSALHNIKSSAWHLGRHTQYEEEEDQDYDVGLGPELVLFGKK